MQPKRELLNHFQALRRAAKQIHGEAFLDVDSFVVELKIRNSLFRLYPQFFEVDPETGRMSYAHEFNDSVKRFSGWKPYRHIGPFPFSKKLVFKELVRRHGFDTPAYWTQSEDRPKDVVIKRDFSAFSHDIRGPFRTTEAQSLDVANGEYFEQFIFGRIVKVWFWNQTPVWMEALEMPRVTGKQQRTIRELIDKRRRRHEIGSETRVQDILRYFGRSFDDVLADGETQVVDFCYASTYVRAKNVEEVSLAGEAMAPLRQILTALGSVLWNEAQRSGFTAVVYTVDGILDAQGKIWFLEANTNPFVHPAVYLPMLSELDRIDREGVIAAKLKSQAQAI